MAKKATQSTDQTTEVEQLFQMGAHLGHRKSRVHPKAYRYIYKFMNGVSIIDLTKTVHSLNKAKTALEAAAKDGKKLLVVATKKNHAATTAELSEKYNVAYMTMKWLPGLLTNFDTLFNNVKKLQDMKEQQANGTWDQFVKHERVELSKELYRLDRFYKGLVNLKKKPDMLLIIDARKEKNSIVEAGKNHMDVVGIVDTNSNPEEVDFPIVMNDDSQEVVKFVLEDLLKTYADAYTEKADAPTPIQGEDAPVMEAPVEKKAEKASK